MPQSPGFVVPATIQSFSFIFDVPVSFVQVNDASCIYMLSSNHEIVGNVRYVKGSRCSF